MSVHCAHKEVPMPAHGWLCVKCLRQRYQGGEGEGIVDPSISGELMVNLWFVTMVKDEADMIGGWIRHAASEGATGVAILDNGSTDHTADIARQVGAEFPHLTVLTYDDPEIGYYQSRKVSRVCEWIGDAYGAEWIVPADADEIWSADVRLDRFFAATDTDVVEAQLFNYYPTAQDRNAPTPVQSMRWHHTDVGALPKVAFRWSPGTVVHQGNHDVTLPGAVHARWRGSSLRVSHFPYRSADQFVRKARNGAAAYAATDLPSWIGTHWRGYGEMLDRAGEQATKDWWRMNFYYDFPAENGLIEDPAPFCRWS